jgi:hypothetical protein
MQAEEAMETRKRLENAEMEELNKQAAIRAEELMRKHWRE